MSVPADVRSMRKAGPSAYVVLSAAHLANGKQRATRSIVKEVHPTFVWVDSSAEPNSALP
jgi:hypothetical protein